jgi:hypothetical protein
MAGVLHHPVHLHTEIKIAEGMLARPAFLF